MILNIHKPPYDIGARRVGCLDGDGVWRADQPFILVREVTQADWIAYCREHCGPKWPTPNQIAETKGDKFFEVASD